MKRYCYFLAALIFINLACSKKEESQNQGGKTPEPKVANAKALPAKETLTAEVDIERTEWQNPQLVLSSLGDLSGKVVADIGAGSGYFTFKMAKSAKKVIALDVDQKALEYINNQIEIVGEWAKKIETRLTPPESPNLSDDEADAILIVNTYFYIPERKKYLQKLLDCIKGNGKLVIVDYKIGDMIVGPSDDFKITPEVIEKELRKSGFKSINVDLQSLKYQFVITAEKR